MTKALEINNPYMLVDDERRKAILVKNRGRDIKSLTTERERVVARLTDTFSEMGNTFDLALITSISGGAGEKVEKIIEMHSDLAGFDDALREMNAIKATQIKTQEGALQEFLDNAGLGIDDGTPMSPFNPQQRTMDAAMQVMGMAKNRGLRLGQAEGETQTYEIDLAKAGMYATLFRKGDAASGWEPEDLRIPGLLIDSIQRPLQVTDIFNIIRTVQSSVKYMQETTFDNNATEIGGVNNEATDQTSTTAATGYYVESQLDVNEQTENIYKIGTHIPVTQEQLDDVGFVRAYLNRRLPFMVRQTLDGRLLAGPAGAGNLTGLMNRSITKLASSGTGARGFLEGTTPTADVQLTGANFTKPLNAILRAQAEVMYAAYGMASHCILHPNMWVIMATQESASGGYYLGNPANAFTPRIWGMPVVQAQTGVTDVASKSGTPRYGALVGDFNNWTDLVVRKDMEVQMGVINIDFLKDILRIKASVRVGLLLYRPQAFVAIENPRSA